jgi:hypothetical protein
MLSLYIVSAAVAAAALAMAESNALPASGVVASPTSISGDALVSLPPTSTPASHPLILVPRPENFPTPTPAQLAYQGGISALAHFGMASFFHDGDPGCDSENWLGCDPNGGCNSSDVNSFAPSNLNLTSWIDSMNDLGATSIVLTAKHGCGFLLWPTNTTVPGSDGTPIPYRYHVNTTTYGNVLADYAAAMKGAGFGYGFVSSSVIPSNV